MCSLQINLQTEEITGRGSLKLPASGKHKMTKSFKINTISFLTILTFMKYVIQKALLINKMQ